MGERFVLVHSPVLGSASWAPAAAALADAGHQVIVPSLSGFADEGPPYAPRLVRRACAQLPDFAADQVVLVVHSGAGALAPYLAEAIPARGMTVVFADAGLPPRSGAATVTDTAFLPFLRDLADDGMVRPWPQWWPADVMSGLFPGERAQRQVAGEARSLPLAFFGEQLPPLPEGWPSCRCAYLRFSEGYLDPAREARARGWPVRELPGEHLHMLIEPAAVATAIVDLAAVAAVQR
ncbi:MAG TPA: alpha/beta hydrolase [Streptosporangiaceae bacterium]